jgi:hypothetical protein
MIKFLKSHIAEVILFVIVLLLALINYEIGSFLSGWDNLQTDLNPILGVKRALWSGWQEYQSFGLPSGMAHASDLVRSIFVLILSSFLPMSMVRFSLHFFMILLGTLGAYTLITRILINHGNTRSHELDSLHAGQTKSSPDKTMIHHVRPRSSFSHASLLGALFYLLNWGTIQILFFAYEGFAIFFGMLPWLTLSYLVALHAPPPNKTRSLLYFAIINILATPSWYSQQLFVVYMLFLGFFTLGMLVTNRYSFAQLFRRSSLLVAITIAINSFWILPQIYFVHSNIGITYSAKINQIHTPKTVMENKDKGTVYDFLTLNSFYTDYVDIQGKHFLGGWLDLRKSIVAKALTIFMGLLPLFSFVKKSQYRIPLLFTYFLCVMLLMSNTPLTSLIDTKLRQIPIYNEIFRTPFTKVISVYTLILSILLAKFLYDLAKNKIIFYSAFLVCTCAIFFLALPAFRGDLFSSQVKTPIPRAYMDFSKYMSTLDKSSRVILLPNTTFWGWYKHSWGYNGSGFLWYAIEQPFVSQTFDVWSSKSEGYYWELRHAIDTRDVEALKKVFTKYDIRYIILDDTLVSIENRDIAKELSFLHDSLQRTGYKLIKDIPIEVESYTMGKIGSIKVYEVSRSEVIEYGKLFVNLPNIESSEGILASGDKAYEKYGDYMSDPGQTYDVLFPFLDFSTAKEKTGGFYDLVENEKSIMISRKITGTYEDYSLVASQKYPLIQANHLIDGTERVIIEKSTRVKNVIISDHLVVAYFITDPIYDLSLETSVFGSYKNKGKFAINYDHTRNILHAEANNGANPYWEYILPDVFTDSSYIIFVDGNFFGSQKPLFTVMRKDNRQIIMTGLLYDGKNYFVIPKSDAGSLGMTLSFSFPSYAYMPSSYDLKEVRIHPFPAEGLNSVELVKPSIDLALRAKNEEFEITKLSYYKYAIKINILEKDFNFVLNQAYDKGWLAYETNNTWFPFFGKKLEDHILVNNWANGWKMPESSEVSGQGLTDENCKAKLDSCSLLPTTYIVVFWPQYLQYLGFGILLATFSSLGFIAWKNRS